MSTDNSNLLTLTIADLARGGAGVAREESGRVVFVPFTAPGDVVRVRVGLQKKHYAQAELVEILTPSPHRVKAPCAVFGTCGGCEWQHLPYEFQWATKKKGLLQSVGKIPGLKELDLESLLDEMPATQVWEYRNRIQARGVRGQLGFFGRKSNELVPIQRCEIARPEINEALNQVRTEGARLSKPYKVEIEVLDTGKVAVSWNQGHAALGFRQVHDGQNLQLKKWIATQLNSQGVLYDLYGGGGNLSLDLSDRFQELHCVDVSSPAASPKGTPAHYRFHQSAVLPWLLRNSSNTSSSARGGSTSAAVIDPPREGLGADLPEIAHALEVLDVRELVLVGCDVDNWTRDLSRWTDAGWKLQRLGMLDLFPQTHHVEALARLERAF